jgi:hypothetical protein
MSRWNCLVNCFSPRNSKKIEKILNTPEGFDSETLNRSEVIIKKFKDMSEIHQTPIMGKLNTTFKISCRISCVTLKAT